LLSVGALAAPGDAATRQTGLINVSLTDTTVQVPIAVAANVCGVAVNVLAAAVAQGPVDCQAIGGSEAVFVDNGGGGGDTTQTGLVNVSATNTTVQVPVGIAANICGVAVNVLATATVLSDVTCTAEGVAIANA